MHITSIIFHPFGISILAIAAIDKEHVFFVSLFSEAKLPNKLFLIKVICSLEKVFHIDIYLSFAKICFMNVPQNKRTLPGVDSSDIKLHNWEKTWNKFWSQYFSNSCSALFLRALFGERQFWIMP